MKIPLQPKLQGQLVKLLPLNENDFERLFNVAQDPEIWQQHPSNDRWKKEVFKQFFREALDSKGAYIILDALSDDVIGSTRFYDFNTEDNSIFIGYTFYGTKYWGTGVNKEIKNLMLNYIFQFVEKVKLHAGPENYRSRRAMEKLGFVFKGEFQNAEKRYVQYEIEKNNWV